MKIGYKVVWNDGESLSSLTISKKDPRRAIYKLNEWTNRKKEHGPLYLFESLAQVKKAYEKGWMLSFVEIYECEYIPSEDKGLSRCEGIVFADAVMLTKLIEKE